MRMLRSRTNRLSSSSSGSTTSKATSMRRHSDSKSFTDNMWGLSLVALLPVIGMAMVSISDLLISPLLQQYKRVPYRYVWSEALDQRNYLAAKYNRLPYLPNGVARLSDLSVAEFRDIWDAKWPIVLTDVVPQWAAYQWSKEFFYKFYSKSNLTVTIAKGSLKQTEGVIMTVGDFYRLTFDKLGPNEWLYATDEHFLSNHPSLLVDIGPNKYSTEDYFKHFPEELRPKNSMLLWGTKHSRSKLHVDPYNWTGTVALIKGVKRWKFYPPTPENAIQLQKQRSGFPLDCPQLVSPHDLYARETLPPTVSERISMQLSFEFDQKAGEIVFIPTGWAHQAYNLEETIAISSQYMNRNNYRSVLEEIIQCTNINDRLPITFSSMTGEEQIASVMSLIPDEVKVSARQMGADLRKTLMCGEDSS